MDIKGIIVSFAIISGAAVAFMLWTGFLNESYTPINGSSIDIDFITPIYGNASQYLGGHSVDVINSTDQTGITDQGDISEFQIRKAFSLIKDVVDFVPNMINRAGLALGIPEQYLRIARYTFGIIFTFVVGYLLFSGIRRLIG